MFLAAPAHLPLLKSLMLLILYVHFAWLGVLAGGATVAVALDFLGIPARRGFATAIIVKLAPGLAAALLGLTAALILLGVQFCYPPLPISGTFWAGTLASLLAGLALLTIYRHLLRRGRGLWLRPGCGLVGIALVLSSCFLLCCGSGLLFMPEKQPFLAAMPLLFLSWSGTVRFIEFTCLVLAATGAVIMLLGERTATLEDARFARRLGGGVALFFIFAWPPVLLFGLFNLPPIALSSGVWLLAALNLALAAILAAILLDALEKPEKRRARPILGFLLVMLAFWVLSDHLARENSREEAAMGGLAAMLESPPAAVKKPATGVDVSAGKAVFERICIACHRFDAKLIGPPLNTVVPNYRKDPKSLKEFIRNPVKRNPAYPAMPKLPLTEAEIEAVAAYLLARATP